MKKLLSLAAAVALAFGIANAGQDVSISEARIYINPGHGSWTANDRNMPTINHSSGDTTGFYESNTNLWKGLKLRQVLIDWGMPADNICMSRVKNGPYPHTEAESTKYNRSLSEIAQEANSFNSDYFISIHSDAGSANHTILIHKGYTTPSESSYMIHGSKYGSKELMQICSDMAHTTWPLLTSNGIDVMNASQMQPGKDPYIVGDLNFYYKYTSDADNTDHKSGYLGVLRTNTCPGFLSEGYSHQYYPATHRALNPDYCGQEGVRYARGMAEWFGWEKEKTGYIMGSVKNLHAHLIHKYYNYAEGSIDQYAPINNAVVTLYKGGVEISKYYCDNEYNGVFVFEKLEPGDDYSLYVEAPGFKSNTELDEEYNREGTYYTVVANETTYPIVLLEASDYVANPCYNYAEPEQSEWLVISDSYEMRQDFTNQTIGWMDGSAASILDGKEVRRQINHGDSIYTLALEADNTPHIYCFDAQHRGLLFELSTEGAGYADDSNEILPISDIAFTSDSILVACNYTATDYYASTGTFRVYAWAKDETSRAPMGSPYELFSSQASQTSGNFYNATTGRTFTVSGRLENCKVITTAQNVNNPGKIRLPIFTHSRKGLIASAFNKADDLLTTELLGDNYTLCVSPLDDNAIIIDGKNTTPMEFTLDAEGSLATFAGAVSEDVVTPEVDGVTFFRYARHVLMATPVNNADGKNIGVALYDVTNGLNTASLIYTSNTSLAAADCSWTKVGTHVEEDDLTIYLIKDNELNSFTTKDVDQAYYENVYAYNLAVSRADDQYTFYFSVNDECIDASLKFYDATSGELLGEEGISSVNVGTNTLTMSSSDLPGTTGQELKWAVLVNGHNVSHIRPLIEKTSDYSLSRAYATVNKYPETSNFGNIYVSNRVGNNKATNGVIVYDNELNRVNESVYRGGITFYTNNNISVDHCGKIYVADGGTSNSGIWVADANLAESTFTQFFEGERTSGVFFNNGAEVGGPTASVSFYGTGEDTKMYVYSQNSNGRFVLNIYNVGTATSWGAAPSVSVVMPADMTIDANVVAVEQGAWIANTISESAVSETAPALLFVSNEGKITFNQGNVVNQALLAGAGGSALAVSNDEKTLVVNDANGVLQFFDVEWNGTTPVLTNKYSYQHEIGIGALRVQDGTYLEQMSFDYAGRLVAGGHYLGVYSIPTEDNSSETPATTNVVNGISGLILETIDADNNAPVEYYNLQGIRVSNPSNGIFIKKQGNKATKVVL